VPQAQVTIRRAGSTTEQTAVADAAGRVVFERLLPGAYVVSAVRLLSAEERNRLTGPNAGVNAFAGGRAADVAAPTAATTVALTAGRPGTLVISEMWFGGGNPEYFWDFYIELYNNGETTQYLDGMVLARSNQSGRALPQAPCEVTERYANDPDGVWVPQIYQFPGSGTQYPVPPGKAVVIATEAIDHKALSARAVDLSRADFEFQGGVDNPQVPNLVSIGHHAPGRGLFWTSIDGVAVLAQPIDVAALPLERLWNDVQVIRIPADKVVDVLSYWSDYQGPNPLCARQVHERFDRQGARVLPVGWDNGVGQKRRALLTLPNGRVVLQRTLTNSRDWIAGPPTPGWVP
jgi:hypothetical protein